MSVSSFVSKVLEHAGTMEQKAIHEKVEILTEKLQDMEIEVHHLAHSKFNMQPCLVEEEEELCQRVSTLQSDMENIESRISSEIKDQLSASTGEFQSLTQDLAETKVILTGLNYLAHVFTLFENSQQAVKKMNYSAAYVSLNKMEAFLKNSVCGDEDEKIPILKAIKAECTCQKMKLQQQLSDIWSMSVKWSVQEKSEASPKQVSVSVRCEGGADYELKETVQGLYQANMLSSRMKTFSDTFQKCLLTFLTSHPDCTVESTSTDNMRTLTLALPSLPSTGTGKAKGKGSKKAPAVTEEEMYKPVFANLITVLEELQAMLLHLDYGWEEPSAGTQSMSDSTSYGTASVGGAPKGTLMAWLGQEVAPGLLDIIQRDLLAKAVPSSAKNLQGFDDVIRATEDLQEKLKSLGLISPDNRTLQEYVANVNLLFANKKSRLIIQEARDFMKSDLLQETVAVSDDKPMGNWPPLSSVSSGKAKQVEITADNLLSDNTFRMPVCRISLNIQCVMKLAYETLQEATESSPDCAIQMFYTVRGIFEAFIYMVPGPHTRSFEELPLGSALHHNNCMFIAHHLLTLGHQFSPLLPKTVDPTFVDLIDVMRDRGFKVLRAQMDRQRGFVLEMLDGADSFSNVEEEGHLKKARQAVQQALHQLNSLHNVWKPVLPINIYKSTLGKLIQAMVERVTDCITSLEDIAQAAAQNLSKLLDPIEEEAGHILAFPGEVRGAELLRHVPGWSRLKQVKLVLAGSLQDISDLWSDGKGPLAEAFTATEVKQMVRALFQNTERRAHVLSMIT